MSGPFTEKDNRGTRQNTVALANTYWLARLTAPEKEPCALYFLRTEDDAKQALLELPCIHIAGDSGQLICTEPLIFGYYRNDSGVYEAFCAGEFLSLSHGKRHGTSFSKYNGHPIMELAPEATSPNGVESATTHRICIPVAEVVFVKEEQRPREGCDCSPTDIIRLRRPLPPRLFLPKIRFKTPYFISRWTLQMAPTVATS